MKRCLALGVLFMVLAAFAGAGVAAETFYTNWGASTEAVKAYMQGQPHDEYVENGTLALEYISEIDSMPIYVTYGFLDDKLYICVYTIEATLADYRMSAAMRIKNRLDGLVLAQMDKPRYMLAPPLENPDLDTVIPVSRMLDAKTSVTYVFGLVPEESRLVYMAAFTDAAHAEAAQELRDFEDYWSGAKSDMLFLEKRDLGAQ